MSTQGVLPGVSQSDISRANEYFAILSNKTPHIILNFKDLNTKRYIEKRLH